MNKEELIAKLKEAKSADQLIAFAKENGVEIAPEKAKELFEQLSGGELSDDALDEVAGAGGFFMHPLRKPWDPWH